MELEEYRSKYAESDEDPGWDAIDQRLGEIYPHQEPQHQAVGLHHIAGGEDPLDGISMYRSEAGGSSHLHFVTYGFSELYYDEDQLGEDYSGFGFELTFRLKPYPRNAEWPGWVWSLLQNLARYVFKTGNSFEALQYLDARSPIRLDTKTDIVALAFALDPELGRIETPHGSVEFIQAYGITGQEFERIKNGSLAVKDLLAGAAGKNPYWVTDLGRSGS